MGTLIINPKAPLLRNHDILHNHVKAIYGYTMIDAHNIVDIPAETPFDYNMVGYYAICGRYGVTAYIVLGLVRDGKLYTKTLVEESDPHEYVDASQAVLNDLSPTTNAQALAWRERVREALRSSNS